MSVLIKGAKIPKSCAECDFIEYDDEYEFECWCPILRINVEEYTADKPAGCPLVEISPHGRLIDADKLIGAITRAMYSEGYNNSVTNPFVRGCSRARHEVIMAPTVIESEVE